MSPTEDQWSEETMAAARVGLAESKMRQELAAEGVSLALGAAIERYIDAVDAFIGAVDNNHYE